MSDDVVYVEPSFLEGMARVLDIGATLQTYKTHGTPEEADAKAIESDFRAIGKDMQVAINEFKKENKIEE